ncbi:MAG: D-glycerate dehydrogenase [Deltaproteobacteria bacterium]|nr:D-glycerate dehydrogenase [Deltaproteobacteria bacterium]
MEKVLVTRRIPQAGLEILEPLCDMVVNPHDRDLTEEELLEMSAGCRAVLAVLSNRIDRAFLEARPEVRLVANFAVGVDNFDLEAARELGVMLSNTPGVLTDATADLTMALLLSLSRRLVEGDRLVRAGGFQGVAPLFMLGNDLAGKTLGIFGLGRIGLAVGQRARAFGLRILYHNRRLNEEAHELLGAQMVSFKDLLSRSDYLCINAPLTAETRGRFDYQAFGRMRPTAYLINTGRGPIVREADLVRALEEGLIAGAALDVYEYEPQVHAGLLGRDDVVLSPHLGSATREVRDAMARLAAGNVAAFLAGEEPPNRLV